MAWAPDYCTLDELRDYVTRDGSTIDDVYLGLAKSSAARAIDQDTGRQFGQVSAPEARTYVARPDYDRGYWCVDVDDFQDATGLLVAIGEPPFLGVTTFVKAPVNAPATGRPWTRIEFTADSQAYPTNPPHDVIVTAKWGWLAVPPTVEGANLLQGSRFATRRQAPFGVAGSPEQGSEMRLLAKVDPDVHVMLNNYRRIRAPQ